MKKLFLFIGALSMSFLNAQDITDAIQYSQQDIFGTARFRAMSGAFGALGGDISALQINPAGSAVFLNSYGSMTLSTSRIDTDANYFNGVTNTNSTNINFNQIGAVFIYDNFSSDSSGINKLSLGLAYEQTADNADEFIVFGRSPNSIDNFFLTEAQGLPLDLIALRPGETESSLYAFLGETEGYNAQQAFLGYNAFVFDAVDPDDPNNTNYVSNVASGSFNQEYFYETTGLNGKFTLNGAAQINDDLYIGFNLNSHFISYDRITDFVEINDNPGSNVNEILFTNRLSTNGAGFSGQIGAIAKVANFLRLGAAFESPTWYYIEEETIQRLETFRNTNGTVVINPDVINIFPEYRLRTPSKVTGSIAILFAQQGLISLDYSYKDYSTIELKSDDGVSFSTLNNQIENELQAVSTIRIGTEWRNGNWSLRGGYLYEESPYKNEVVLGERTGYSLGFGYNFGQFKFDFAYDYSEQEREEQFFPDSGFTNFSVIDTNRDNFTFTLGMNF